jgi:hypothetical protein
MPAAIWAAPMARVRLGRLERPCMRSRQGLGPRFQALASATGWMRAMTPSPMRTMAAKCFVRAGVVMSIVVGGVTEGVVLSVGFVVAQAKCGGPSAAPQDDGEEQATAMATANTGVLPLRCARGSG